MDLPLNSDSIVSIGTPCLVHLPRLPASQSNPSIRVGSDRHSRLDAQAPASNEAGRSRTKRGDGAGMA
ncbi:MAG: hypothetical protein O9345_08500 [Burkholderiaceae bacterium]|nr:hypothetical protein [Burkholderiaceae bacterium]